MMCHGVCQQLFACTCMFGRTAATQADAGAEAAEAAYWRLRGPLPPTLGALQSQVAAAVQ